MKTEFAKLIKDNQLEGLDFIIIADGSGSTLSKPCGFWSYIYDKYQDKVFSLGGSLTHGTNNLAEIMPFIHSIFYLKNGNFLIQDRDILCISDSEVLVKQGKDIYQKTSMMWSIIDSFGEQYCSIEWKWMARNSNEILKKCDENSKLLRSKI